MKNMKLMIVLEKIEKERIKTEGFGTMMNNAATGINNLFTVARNSLANLVPGGNAAATLTQAGMSENEIVQLIQNLGGPVAYMGVATPVLIKKALAGDPQVVQSFDQLIQSLMAKQMPQPQNSVQ